MRSIKDSDFIEEIQAIGYYLNAEINTHLLSVVDAHAEWRPPNILSRGMIGYFNLQDLLSVAYGFKGLNAAFAISLWSECCGMLRRGRKAITPLLVENLPNAPLFEDRTPASAVQNLARALMVFSCSVGELKIREDELLLKVGEERIGFWQQGVELRGKDYRRLPDRHITNYKAFTQLHYGLFLTGCTRFNSLAHQLHEHFPDIGDELDILFGLIVHSGPEFELLFLQCFDIQQVSGDLSRPVVTPYVKPDEYETYQATRLLKLQRQLANL